MVRIIVTSILCFFLLPLAAQKKEISTARDQVKQGKDLEKAEQSMMKLLADSSNKSNEKIWNILFDALQKQYNQGNEKLYLKQKYDTASLFNVASRMFTAMESYDSIDARPDRDGNVRPKMRKDNASKLNLLRPNLYNGGIYYIRKQNYAKAYPMLDQYIACAEVPMFQSYNYQENDQRIPEAAYWAVFCGYKLKDAKKVYHHTYHALKDTAHTESMMQLLAATYMLDGDTARYVATLADGVQRYPLSDYFYPLLASHYSSHKEWEKALTVTEYVLKADSTNKTALLTKSGLLLNVGDYAASLPISLRLIERDSTLAEAWLNTGLAYFNQGVTLDKNVQTLKKKREEILDKYRCALPYLEQYRQMKPESTDKWALPLYTIYLNLNMGAKFDEIDKILKK